MLADWWAAPAPPASVVRNHRVGQTITASSIDADTGTGWAGSRTGSTDRDAARVPHHDDGSACGTSGRSLAVSPASRASRRAAAARSAGVVPGSATVRRSSLTSPASESGRAGRPSTFSTGTPSSARKRDGWSPSSSARGDGGDDQSRPGAGARDVEEAALLLEQLATR